MKKILISDKLAKDGIDYLKAQDDITIHFETGLSEEALCERIAEVDALLIRSDTQVTENVLRAAKHLKLIGRAGIGVDNVDIPAATEMGVIVMNTPDANATTTAELTIAHLMSLSRHLPAADKSVRQGKWERSKFTGSEVAQKTLGIIGFGTIGRLVASRADVLKMKVIAYDPFVSPEIYTDLQVESVSLDDLVSRSDYITLHCPLIEKTRNIIGAAQFEKMKNSAMLINCARGGLIDEEALYHALKNKHIAGAALDVFDVEPPVNSPLLELDNIVFTPHLGASTSEAQLAVSVEIAKQAVTFLRTGEAINALNLPRVSADELKKSTDFVKLATQLGSILAGLSTAPLTKLEVVLFGRAAEVATRPVSVGALIGVLSGKFSTPVNRVNAENIAKRQGLSLVESVSHESQDYVSLITLTGHSKRGQLSVSGVLLGGRQPRLISINDLAIEVIPEGTLLITMHEDKPGVISAMSAILGDAKINISRMQVSVSDSQEKAMAVISVSELLHDDLLLKLRNLASVHQVTQLVL